MTTQTQSSSSSSLRKRILKVLWEEGLHGILQRIEDRWQTSFDYYGGYLVASPITERGQTLTNPLGVQVAQISENDPGILQELVQVYAPDYTEEMLITRWRQQRLLGFIGRVNGEAVGCVWVNPGGAVYEFNRPIYHLAADEAYFKDAMVKPAWRGKAIYPLIKERSGQILREQYGKKTALSFIEHTNTASLNASRKLGARRVGRIFLLKLFRRKFAWLVRSRAKPL